MSLSRSEAALHVTSMTFNGARGHVHSIEIQMRPEMLGNILGTPPRSPTGRTDSPRTIANPARLGTTSGERVMAVVAGIFLTNLSVVAFSPTWGPYLPV